MLMLPTLADVASLTGRIRVVGEAKKNTAQQRRAKWYYSEKGIAWRATHSRKAYYRECNKKRRAYLNEKQRQYRATQK